MENSCWLIDDGSALGNELQQGDLIAFETDDRLKKFGIVITADCDLAQRKHARLVTVVSLIEIQDVIEYYLLLEYCEKQRPAITKFVQKKFGITINFSTPEATVLLQQAVLSTSGDSSMKIPILGAKILLHEVDHLPIQDFYDLMKNINISLNNFHDRLTQQLQGKGDLLVLSKIDGLSSCPKIAWVRQIWQIQLKDIVFKNSQTTPTKGQRIARLESPYRYRLTQLMGQVFSDIGLPDNTHPLDNEVSAIITKKASE